MHSWLGEKSRSSSQIHALPMKEAVQTVRFLYCLGKTIDQLPRAPTKATFVAVSRLIMAKADELAIRQAQLSSLEIACQGGQKVLDATGFLGARCQEVGSSRIADM